MLKNKRIAYILKAHYQNEDGLSLVELLVSIAILAIVVLFSSTLFITSSRTSSTMENRTKALQIGNDVIANAEQAPYRQLYTPIASTDPDIINATSDPNSDKCDIDGRTLVVIAQKFSSLVVRQPDDYSLNPSWDQYREFKGITYCQKRYFGQEEAEQVGTTFYVQTDIVYSIFGTDDHPTRAEAGNVSAAEGLKSKRVVVTVRWKDVHSTDSTANSVVIQKTILPNAWDCPIGHVDRPANSTSNNATTNGFIGCY